MQFYLNGAEATLSDFAADDLARAVLNSLFSWARAEEDDTLPGKSRFGWWADSFSDEGDKFGSRLWLLMRSKLSNEVLAKAEEYAYEALHWLQDDGVVSGIRVTAERGDADRLNLLVELTRPNAENLTARFYDVWEEMR